MFWVLETVLLSTHNIRFWLRFFFLYTLLTKGLLHICIVSSLLITYIKYMEVEVESYKQEGHRTLDRSPNLGTMEICFGLWLKRYCLKIFLFLALVTMLFSRNKLSEQFGLRAS